MPMKYPVHPGRLIQTNMKVLGMEVPEASLRLNIMPETLAQVLNGESSVTAEMAVELGMLFGNGTDIWCRLQALYDEAQKRNANEVHAEPQLSAVHQQKATVALEYGRMIFETIDAEVIALHVMPSANSELSEDPIHDRVEYRFVGEGPGAVKVQMIYQPSKEIEPQLVAHVLFKAYLVWNAEKDEYIGHIDAEEWNRETQKLYDGKERMNSLFAGLKEEAPVPALVVPETDVLKEAEELLHKATKHISGPVLAAF